MEGMTPKALPLPVAGPFDLNASTRFLEGFTPAGRPDAGAEPDLLRLAFPVEGAWVTVGAAVRQHGDRLTVELAGSPPDAVAGTDQVARMLSLDVDGRGFADVGRRDPVVATLQRRYRGLRPVLFPSPYEAACWSIIGQRIRMPQAAVIKARIAETLGETIDVAGQQMTAFPAPGVLRDAVELPGLPPLKAERLRGVAAAALDGRLSAARLRCLDTADALDELTALPGIGPFSAQLVLVRGAGHPDLFPTAERRLQEEMALAYQLVDPTLDQLVAIAETWRPYRSWVSLLLRAKHEDQR